MPSVALIFHGPMNYPATKSLRNALCNFGSKQQMQNFGNAVFDQLFLLMSSEGGSVEDAFSLYNLILALPTKVIIVNMGQIASGGNIPFLAGEVRWACEHSYFHFHNLSWTISQPQSFHRIQLADTTQILDTERALYKGIFKKRTTLSEKDFETLQFLEQPLIKDTSFAKEKGIVHHIGMPAIPAGAPILNVDY